MVTEYNCAECASKATPYCEKCHQITKPSGKQTKPTLFVKLGTPHRMVMSDDDYRRFVGIKLSINVAVLDGKPIPLSAVTAYNELIGKYQEQEG